MLQLETIDFQLDLLMNQPMPIQAKLVEETIDQAADFERVTANLVTAWLSGDDAAFEQAFSQQSGTSAETRAFMNQLMDQRNVGMADKIAQFLAGEGSYFVLVGAGHLVGDKSVIALLSERGHRGTRRIHRP